MLRISFKKYVKDKRGQFAVWFAIIGFPMTVGVSLAVDTHNARRVHTNLQAALDSAALAAVMNQKLASTERATFAEAYFWDNFESSHAFNVDIGIDVKEATENRVVITASGHIDASVGGAIGLSEINIDTNSIAERTTEHTICVLTLNPTDKHSFSVTDKADFTAEKCSVQVNSAHDEAAFIDKKSNARAEAFCTHGASKGIFTPFANSECRRVNDPHIDLVSPAPLPCNGLGAEAETIGKWSYDPNNHDTDDDDDNPGSGEHLQKHAGHNDDKHHNHKHTHFRASGIYTHSHNHPVGKHHTGDPSPEIDPVEAEIGLTLADEAVVFPGTYCDGIRIIGEGVRFMPGQYDVHKGLFFKSGGASIAEDVVFVFHGIDTELRVEEDASLYVKAPSLGRMAGMAFFHKPRAHKELPIGTNYLKGGGNLDVRGTVYFPYHTLEIGKGSEFASEAPATSYISYNAHFTGGSKTVIQSDHEAADLPRLKPHSDSSARLVE